MEDCRIWLQSELDQRKRKNTAYSLRSLAKNIGVAPSTLSQILSGKRELSLSTANKCFKYFGTSENQAREILLTVSGKKKNDFSYHQLALDEFHLISHWYHFAIVSLGELPHKRKTPLWISRRLNIKITEAKEALERLERLGLIEREGQDFKNTNKTLNISSEQGHQAIRQHHHQVLCKAQESLDEVSPQKRDISSTTMAIDPENLKQAKQKIARFREEMMELLKEGKKSKIYSLAIQLFPLEAE